MTAYHGKQQKSLDPSLIKRKKKRIRDNSNSTQIDKADFQHFQLQLCKEKKKVQRFWSRFSNSLNKTQQSWNNVF